MTCSNGPNLEMKDLSQETFDGGTNGFISFGDPYIGPTLDNQQCTYSQINGTTQPGIKTDSETHRELAFLKNDKDSCARNRCPLRCASTLNLHSSTK